MFKNDTEDSQRRLSGNAGDPVYGFRTDEPRIPCRDHDTNLRVAGLVAALLTIFGGIAWILQAMVEVPAHGAPIVLAAAGSQPPDTAQAGAVEPSICALCYPDESPAASLSVRSDGGQRVAAVEPRLSGIIEVSMRHELSSGRLVITLGERTALSKPFESRGGDPGIVSHRLSVPAGSHHLKIAILGARGEVYAESEITAEIDPERIARLHLEHRGGMTHTLNLSLSSGEQAGAPAIN